MRVAVVDSGINSSHPRISSVAGSFVLAGDDDQDRVGHGTAVAATILEHAAAHLELYSVKIFDRTLACRIDLLVRAIEWCANNAIYLANLSVGTPNPSHAGPLARAVEQARSAGVIVVSAHGWLPGNLDGVIAVDEDRTCPRDKFRMRKVNGRSILACSGRPPAGDLKGISFAVANATGLLAGALGTAETLRREGSLEAGNLLDLLIAQTEL